VVVITFALHAKGLQFDPGQHHLILHSVTFVNAVKKRKHVIDSGPYKQFNN
ncbi:unnamed protein product, partial [Brassica rapa subsp. trilocularis]